MPERRYRHAAVAATRRARRRSLVFLAPAGERGALSARAGRGCSWEGRSGVDGSRVPTHLVQLFAVLDMQELPDVVPYFDPVVYAQSQGERGSEDELAVGGPLAVRCFGGVNRQ